MNIRLAGYIVLCAVAISLPIFAFQKTHNKCIFKQIISRNRAYLVLFAALMTLLAIFVPYLNQQIEEMKKNL